MKVAFFLENSRISNRIIENLDLGNPGLGGTEYIFFNMVVALSRRNDMDVTLFLTTKQPIEYDINIFLVKDIYDAIDKAKEQRFSIIVTRNNQPLCFYKYVDEKKMPLVVWAHNYNQKELMWVRNSVYTKKYVCVSKAQLEANWHLCSHKKTIYIFTGISSSQIADKPDRYKKCYVVSQGALEEQKGFHVLARIWPEIHKKVPDATLHVIGSGKLYDDSSVMGKYGLANEKYEKEFMKYIIDSKGNIDPSVVFHGKMVNASEKRDLIKQSSVGVLNLTGASECCPLSGVEMQALGVPVVTTVRYGCRDVVRDKFSGYTVRSEREAVSKIVMLLTDNDKNQKFSKNSISFVHDRFDSEKSYAKWAEMLKGIEKNSKYVGQQDVGIKYRIYSTVYRLAKFFFKRELIYR